MNQKIKEMIEEIEDLKKKLAEEIALEEKYISHEIKNNRIIFEKDALEKQKTSMKNLSTYFSEIPLIHLLSAPIVFIMIVPAILMDIMLFVYQKVVFRIFKLGYIKRSDYIVFDRQYLGYLNIIEKINCLYCSYFNGLTQYASKIAARTEFYFCPIKHAKKIAYEHSYYHEYCAYGNAVDYHKELTILRKNLQDSIL